MGSIGFEGAGGQQAMAEQIRQRIQDQIAQQQQAFQNNLSVRGADRADRALSQQDELTRLKIKELSDQKAATEADQQFRIGTTLSNTIPSGAVLPLESPAVKPLQALGQLREQASTLPSTSYIGTQMTAPQPENPNTSIQGTLRMASNTGNPRQFVKLPSQAEGIAASTDDLRHQQAEQRLQEATTRADQAWTRLQQGQQTASALAGFHQSQLELQQAKLEAERAKNDAAAAKTPQPQFFVDGGGKTHAVIFDKGTLTEVPLPAGYTPTKAAAPGFFDKISHMFSGGDTSATPTAETWVRDGSGKLVRQP